MGALAKTTILTSSILVFRLLVLAASLILITHLFDPKIYGSYVSVFSIATLLGILPNLGSGFVMLSRSGEGRSGVIAVWRYTWPATILVGLALLFLYMPIARYIDHEQVLSGPMLFCIGLIEIVHMPIVTLCSYIFQSMNKVPMGQIIQWMPLFLRTLLIIPAYWVSVEYKIHMFIIGQLLGSIIGLVIGLILSSKIIRFDWKPEKIKWEEFKKGFSYLIMHFVAINPSELDKIISMRFIGSHDLGIYSASNRIMVSVITPITAMLLAAQPRLFQYGSAHRFHESRRLVLYVALLSLAWGIIAWLGLTLLSPILPWLFGAKYDPMAILMPYIAVSVLPLTLRISGGTILVALGKPIHRMICELTGIIGLIVSIMLLTPEYGVKGLAGSLALSESLMVLTGWMLIIHRLR